MSGTNSTSTMVSLWWDHAYIMHSHKQDVHHKDTSAAGGEETETQPISVHQKFAVSVCRH
ncbi:hypothetical protein FG05_12133 [Fusarium graminearum]|nr:hypothetical protein FG05_12133 [Fusarium graminearum]